MPTQTQDGRFMAITTPLGQDVLLLDTFSGKEAISQLFRFKLGMYAADPTQVKFDKILGQNATVTFTAGDTPRYFNGIISRFSQGQRVKGLDQSSSMIRFEAELVPQIWLLTKSIRNRMFQQKSIPDILKEVFDGMDFVSEIQGTFAKRNFCVQYRESDFDFASRLMEEEGIYYFFKHTESGHQMVLANTPGSHPAVPGPASIKYEEEVGAGAREDERIDKWVKSQEIRTGKHTLRDHSFELPDDNLEADDPITDAVQSGTVSHKFNLGINANLENYDFPGGYARRFDGVDSGGSAQAGELRNLFQDNIRTVHIRMQEEAAAGLIIEAQSDCRLLTTGHKFTLIEHFDANGDYVLTEVEHKASIEGTYAPATSEEPVPVYANSFRCIPFALPYRPQRKTQKTRVQGTQTATVVGPPGEEIFPDKYGRVKVQFRWDREDQQNASSSCWVRVATSAAGKQFGMINIPRVGQEVIVAFLDGDPDQPIIIGSVFNANTLPTYGLPGSKTQSGFKSRSSPGGGADQFNELRFEDKAGSEELFIQAQKDFNLKVKNNHTAEVEKDRSATIKSGNDTTTVSAGKSSTEAAQSIELTVGGNSITINQQGITIKGIMVKIEGQATIDLKSAMTTINGDGTLTLKGGITMIN